MIGYYSINCYEKIECYDTEKLYMNITLLYPEKTKTSIKQ